MARHVVRGLLLPVLVVVFLVSFLTGGAAVVVLKLRGRAFLRAVSDEVLRQLGELRPDLIDAARRRAADIVAAQAWHETGGGGTIAWRAGWNFSNLCAGSSWSGPVTPGPDTEPDGAGGMRRITQNFRKYDSLAAAVSDYFRALNWSRYRPARDALMLGDLEGFATKLHDDDPATALIEGGWYTATPESYIAGMLSAFERTDGLA